MSTSSGDPTAGKTTTRGQATGDQTADDAHQIPAVASAEANRLAEAVNTHCPWSGEPISSDALLVYHGRVVGFCTAGCRDKFLNAVTFFETAIASHLSRD